MAAGILFGVLFLMLFLGVPIAICLGIASAVTMVVTGNVQYLAAVPTRMFTQLDSFTLMAVPFFILAGNIMAEGGISARPHRLPGAAAQASARPSGLYLRGWLRFLRRHLRLQPRHGGRHRRHLRPPYDPEGLSP